MRALRAAFKMVQRRLRREVLSTHGLSRTALQVFSALFRSGGGTPSGLASELRMTSSNVAAALRELESAGHIDRRPDPDDGRRARIALTASGQRAVQDIRAERDTWLGRAIAAELDETEQELLARAGRLLVRVASHEDDSEKGAGL